VVLNILGIEIAIQIEIDCDTDTDFDALLIFAAIIEYQFYMINFKLCV